MGVPSPHDDPEQRRRRPVGYFDLLHDLPLAGCAVCRGEQRAAWRYLDGLLWEGVTDPWIRGATKRSHGFCRDHSMLAVTVAGKESGQLGMAILFEDLLRHVEQEAIDATKAGPWRRRRRPPDPLATHQGCQVCASGDATAANYLSVLAGADPASALGSAARSEDHPVLCLHHLRMGARVVGSEEEFRRLLDVFTFGTGKLRGELLEFIRKRDYRFANEAVTEGEATAWMRAVFVMVGEPRRQPAPRR